MAVKRFNVKILDQGSQQNIKIYKVDYFLNSKRAKYIDLAGKIAGPFALPDGSVNEEVLQQAVMLYLRNYDRELIDHLGNTEFPVLERAKLEQKLAEISKLVANGFKNQFEDD